MNILHFEITVTPEECGHPRTGEGPADLTAYLLEPRSQAPDRLRPAVITCPGGGYGFVSRREDQAVAMEYLACCLGTMWNRDALYGPLGLAAEEIRPDGMLLCYPVITSGAFAHRPSFEHLLGQNAADPGMRELVSLELQAGPHTPKTFLWHTWSDSMVPMENSLLMAQALRRAGVPFEMHIYPRGKHGLSLANEEVSNDDGDCLEPHCQGWLELSKEWIRVC